MSKDYKTIQNNLISLLKIYNVKQSELAEAIGVYPRTVNRWIKGASNKPVKIPAPQLNNIADFFGLSGNDLCAPDLIERLFVNLWVATRKEVVALGEYLAALGVNVKRIEEGKQLISINDKKRELPIYKSVVLTWSENGKEKTKTISYERFIAFAMVLKDITMSEIKYMKKWEG